MIAKTRRESAIQESQRLSALSRRGGAKEPVKAKPRPKNILAGTHRDMGMSSKAIPKSPRESMVHGDGWTGGAQPGASHKHP